MSCIHYFLIKRKKLSGQPNISVVIRFYVAFEISHRFDLRYEQILKSGINKFSYITQNIFVYEILSRASIFKRAK